MKQQPGFISTQLHRGTAGSTTYVNVAVWNPLSRIHGGSFMNGSESAAVRAGRRWHGRPAGTAAGDGRWARQ
jgi:heme-degrading monooxygenase HmoA